MAVAADLQSRNLADFRLRGLKSERILASSSAPDFDDFHDDEPHWELRPTLWIEPIGDWGKGSVTLVEIPPCVGSEQSTSLPTGARRPPRSGAETFLRLPTILVLVAADPPGAASAPSRGGRTPGWARPSPPLRRRIRRKNVRRSRSGRRTSMPNLYACRRARSSRRPHISSRTRNGKRSASCSTLTRQL